MRKAACSTALVLALVGRGQNLVGNPSFEEYTDCPVSFGQWNLVVGWDSPYTMSADYFNACAGGTTCSVPFNHFGYQYPADGDAYMGLATFGHDSPDLREIITAQLTEPLQIGVPVYLSLKASPGGFGSWVGNSSKWKARGPGMKFMITPPSDWQSYLYPNSAAVHMDQVLSDTSTWVTVSGSYTPDSAYGMVAIANFFEDSLSTPSILDPNGAFPAAYAFIDQVCVSYDPMYCVNWSGIAERPTDALWPLQNPFGEELILRSTIANVAPLSLSLFDVMGRLVWDGAWPAGQTEMRIPASGLPQGSYYLQVKTTMGAIKSIALVHHSVVSGET